MTALAFRSSLSLGLFAVGALCAACGGSDGSDADGTSAGAASGGSGGASVVSHAGAGGASASAGGTGFGTAGTNNGSGGTFASGGGGASGLAGGTATGGTGGNPAAGGSGGASSPGGSGGAGGGTTVPSGKLEFAPYYEIGSTTGAFKNLTDMKTKSGVSDVTLAFVLAGSGCATDDTVSGDLTDIKAFIAAGGHVKASFGGADGKYVEANCTDASSLASAIEKFVDSTGITDLDFDVEQAPVETTAMNQMRGQALKMVQDSKHAQVSFTLQTDESGLDKGARSVVTEAVNAGVSIYHVNLMVMDYGDMPDGTPMAPIAIKSLNGANTQLKAIISGLTTAQAWAMLGATPDIGQNDDAEIFTLQDAQDLATFATTNKLGLLTFWNIQRDQVCGKGECSEHDNANFDYAKVFLAAAQ